MQTDNLPAVCSNGLLDSGGGAKNLSGEAAQPLVILSLGAGVQSSTLALMAANGQTQTVPDAAIFADTQAEPESVYAWLVLLQSFVEKSPHPFPVYVVTAGSLTEMITTTRLNAKTGKRYYSNMIPAFAKNPDGTKGIIGRRCTANFKIDPITKKIRELIGKPEMKQWRRGHKSALAQLREHAKAKKEKRKSSFPHEAFAECQASPLVIQWIGISLDEATRMKVSRDPWSRNEWPLVDARMTRHDCMIWMKKNGYPQAPRSACVYCPFHSDAEWRRLRDDEPESFAAAAAAERGLQRTHMEVETEGKMTAIAYLHDSLVPLDKVDFSTKEDHGQQTMFQNECEGMCGV